MLSMSNAMITALFEASAAMLPDVQEAVWGRGEWAKVIGAKDPQRHFVFGRPADHGQLGLVTEFDHKEQGERDEQDAQFLGHLRLLRDHS